MTDQVFLFGSFTEDEANSYQSSSVASSAGKKKQSPTKPIKENGSHAPSPPSSVAKQNGHSSLSKGIVNSNSQVSANGTAAVNAVDALGKTLGQSPKKQPVRPGVAVAVGGGKSAVRASVTRVSNNSLKQTSPPAPIARDLGSAGGVTNNSVKHTSVPNSNDLVSAENADPADWLVVNSLDISGSKVDDVAGRESSAKLQSDRAGDLGGVQEVVSTVKGVAGSEVGGSPEKNGSGVPPDDDSEAVPTKLLPKSWAALVGVPGEGNSFHKQPAGMKGKGKGPAGQSGGQKLQSKEEVVAQVTALSGQPWLKSLREADVSGRRLQPRGLINTGNSCFLNSTVQAMLSCSAFTHLLQVLKNRTIPETGYPTLRAFVEFSGEFGLACGQSSTKTRRDGDGKAPVGLDVGKPFAPAMFDVVLQNFTPDQPSRATGRNRQEDAQEFLSFVIDRMHEEILRLQGKNSPSVQSISSMTSSEDDDWEMVGPKNRSAVTRTHTFSESAITDIFGGQLRSVVKTKGNKASATVQPFLVLHLDIVPEVVHSVEDALRFFAAPESLEGYKPSTAKVGEVVSASKSVKIQTLPRVLILHLMRFSYGSGGSSKLHKPVQFPLELTLGRELLASTTTSGNEIRKYELVATVSHHGKDPSVGHYTADSKQATGQWLHFDDGVVSGVGVTRVLQEQAYVLFYKRASF